MQGTNPQWFSGLSRSRNSQTKEPAPVSRLYSGMEFLIIKTVKPSSMLALDAAILGVMLANRRKSIEVADVLLTQVCPSSKRVRIYDFTTVDNHSCTVGRCVEDEI